MAKPHHFNRKRQEHLSFFSFTTAKVVIIIGKSPCTNDGSLKKAQSPYTVNHKKGWSLSKFSMPRDHPKKLVLICLLPIENYPFYQSSDDNHIINTKLNLLYIFVACRINAIFALSLLRIAVLPF